MYSMKELSEKVYKSPQALYALIKRNKEFASVVNQNKVKCGSNVKYAEPVLQWLVDYYNPNNLEEVPPQSPEQPPHSSNEPHVHTGEIDDLKAQIERLRKENSSLQALYQKADDERQQLMQQAGALTLVISQMQQERMLLLSAPTPRKTLSEKLKKLIDSFRRAKIQN